MEYIRVTKDNLEKEVLLYLGWAYKRQLYPHQ